MLFGTQELLRAGLFVPAAPAVPAQQQRPEPASHSGRAWSGRMARAPLASPLVQTVREATWGPRQLREKWLREPLGDSARPS